jgi:GTP-binding protein
MNLSLNEHTVAIVGRPNVGKSALFNRLVRKQISLVFDRPGTTRDRIVASGRHRGHAFTLIDTGGIGLEDQEGFAAAIGREAGLALETATDILMVVDAREGLTPLDHEVARRLRRSRAPVHVVANKVDDPDKHANWETEFAALGFGNPLPVSAAHGAGIEDLLDRLTAGWDKPLAPSPPTGVRPCQVAIVGRPNVGKSSLVNALIEDARTIVSPTPGTTRDAIDVRLSHEGKEYVLVDTAGMRQRRRVHDPLEAAMTGRSAHTIHRADICVLVIDAETLVTMQDKKIGGLISKTYRPCMIVVNKWDLARKEGAGGKAHERETYETLMEDLFFLRYAPVVFLSAKTGERVRGVLQMLSLVDANRTRRLPTGLLNRVLHRALERRPPPGAARRFKILYATQQVEDDPGEHPVPTLMCFVNDPKLLSDSYQRYLEEQVRAEFDLRGCPIKWILRSRKPQE